MATKFGEGFISLRARSGKLAGDMRSARRIVSGGMRGFRRAVGRGALATGGLFPGLKARASLTIAGLASVTTKFASDAEEIKNLFDVVMGSMGDDAEAFAQKYNRTMGVSITTTRKALGEFMNLGNAMGVTEEKSLEMSKGLTKLAFDLSSFFNVGRKDALVKLKAGIVGEIEPMRQFGVVLNESKVQNEALRLGLVASTKEMTEAAKVQARYSLILKGTKNAQGDLARTNEMFANTVRRLVDKFKDIGAEIGKQLLPPLTQFLLFIDRMIPAAQKFGKKLKLSVIGWKFGFLLAIQEIKGALAKLYLDGIIQVQKYVAFFKRSFLRLGAFAANTTLQIGRAFVAFAAVAMKGVNKLIDGIRVAWSHLVFAISDTMLTAVLNIAKPLQSLATKFGFAGAGIASAIEVPIKKLEDMQQNLGDNFKKTLKDIEDNSNRSVGVVQKLQEMFLKLGTLQSKNQNDLRKGLDIIDAESKQLGAFALSVKEIWLKSGVEGVRLAIELGKALEDAVKPQERSAKAAQDQLDAIRSIKAETSGGHGFSAFGLMQFGNMLRNRGGGGGGGGGGQQQPPGPQRINPFNNPSAFVKQQQAFNKANNARPQNTFKGNPWTRQNRSIAIPQVDPVQRKVRIRTNRLRSSSGGSVGRDNSSQLVSVGQKQNELMSRAVALLETISRQDGAMKVG